MPDAAAVGIGADGTDVEVQLGDAADEVIVGARDRARENLAIVARLIALLVVGDELVVGVFELHLGDGGVEALDERHAGFRERRHRHQGCALRELLAAVVGFHLAGVVGDLADGDAQRPARRVGREAAQGRRVRRFVGDDRRVADRCRVTSDRIGGRAHATRERDRGQRCHKGQCEITACARIHGRGSLSLSYLLKLTVAV